MSIENFTSLWWEEESEDDQLVAATRLFRDYVQQDQARLSALNAWDAIYTNRKVSAGSPHYPAFRGLSPDGKNYSSVPLNVAKVFVDAVHSRVTRQAISVKFLTDTHNFDNRSGARMMERYVDFQEHQQGGEKIAKSAWLDSAVRGTGCVLTEEHPMEDDVVQTRLRAQDVFVDPVAALRSNKPIDMFRREWVPRSLLKALYPGNDDAIKKAGDISPVDPKYDTRGIETTRKHLVEVITAWRRPSYKDAGDGRFIKFIDKKVLDSGEWENCDFPISFTRWKDCTEGGFWGIGLVEELVGVHFDINNSLFSVYRTVELMPRPIAYLPVGAKVKEGLIGNLDGLLVEFVDGKPSIELPASVPGDMVNLIQMQWAKGLEVSRLAALGLPESTGGGFETGQAIRDFNDIQSTELSPNYAEWQDFRVKVAEQLVSAGHRVNERAKENGRTYNVVLSKDRYTVEDIDWTKIPLDPRKDSFVIQALPASALSQTFAGKKADVIDLLNNGLIDREEALALLDFPDTSEAYSLYVGDRKSIQRDIQAMLETNRPIPFDPNNNLRLGLKLFQQNISKARAMEVPEERVQLLRDVVEQITSLIEKEQLATRNAAAGLGPGLPGSPPALDINGSSPQANAEGMM